GILPAATYLDRVHQALGAAGYREVPTLFWFGAGDKMLQAGWIAGCLASMLAFDARLRRPAFLAAWALYLSYVSVGQDFFSFQWDQLLLEAGFVAIFLGWSKWIIWLFRWLLFRLMFLSGAVKLMSGDPTWRNFTALEYHYQTQPLPTPLAWYAHQWPRWFQHLSVAGVLGIELFIPFLIFMPRRVRRMALVPLAGLQILILLTGNYAFFNWLALALCLFLLDDRDLRYPSLPAPVRPMGRRLAYAAAALVFTLSTYQFLRQFALVPAVPNPAEPFGIANNYGLFAVMTTTRPEIVIEGSNDGSHWESYEFRYKPGDPKRRPAWVAPYQPRLDWQMWFAALGSPADNPWFVNLLARLLQGSPDVLSLFERNPFPGAPPRYVRALLYDYKFDHWWRRELLGLYVRPISLADLR
ncbi:MAG: lipase maturation factor family protein, partial [Bryobacteraceae bacterium]